MNMDTQYDKHCLLSMALRLAILFAFVCLLILLSLMVLLCSLQDNTQQFTTLTVSSQKNVATPYTTAERTMSIDDFSELTMAPMINALAGKVALDIMTGSEGGVC
jgi:predicted neutral ceramidase superfamily lipid hydrolase